MRGLTSLWQCGIHTLTNYVRRIIAATLFVRQAHKRGAERQKVDGWLVLRFSVPALLYACSNNLHYYALQYLDPPIFQVLLNMGIPIVAVTHRVVMGKKKTGIQVNHTHWRSIEPLGSL